MPSGLSRKIPSKLRKQIDHDKFKQFYFVMVPNSKLNKTKCRDEISRNEEYTVMDFNTIQRSNSEMMSSKIIESLFHFHVSEKTDTENETNGMKVSNSEGSVLNTIVHPKESTDSNNGCRYNFQSMCFPHSILTNQQSETRSESSSLLNSKLMLSLDYEGIVELLTDEQSPYYQMLKKPIFW
ncbi:predicted protein [Naegleria gruberi]|uniref:Predicted protein n=1 Tax=Naegleria gruberi TaxID=5762 RepID=D2W5C8_NAEGR|nr:uncharacterized protein NAEGRDRAFT_76618 [Naegleria gruberi]EFC35726.1 predicted protein [Naegleria gruberi]|eukprot:XP_002668470.1 predicted protein [Naegleria gruberi strain NEG-M]